MLFGHYISGRVIDLSHIRDYGKSVLSKSYFLSENEVIRQIGVIGDMPLKVIDGNVEHLLQELSNLRVGLIELLRLEQCYTGEAEKKDKLFDKINVKEFIGHDKRKSFQYKTWLH